MITYKVRDSFWVFPNRVLSYVSLVMFVIVILRHRFRRREEKCHGVICCFNDSAGVFVFCFFFFFFIRRVWFLSFFFSFKISHFLSTEGFRGF